MMKKNNIMDFIICFVPTIGMILAQFLVSFVGLFLYGIVVGFQMVAEGMTDVNEMTARVMNESSSQLILVLVLANLVTAVLFGLWYTREVDKEESRAALKRLLTFKNMACLIFLAIGIQVMTTMVLAILGTLLPKALEGYQELLASTGMGTTVLSLLAIVILAPIAEELVFRGMTLKLAHKILPFWGANFLQAFLFGLIHGNLIQGAYAFVFGLILGCMMEWTKTIYAPVLLHIFINLAGCVLSWLLGGAAISVGGMLILMILSLVIGVCSFWGIYQGVVRR